MDLNEASELLDGYLEGNHKDYKDRIKALSKPDLVKMMYYWQEINNKDALDAVCNALEDC